MSQESARRARQNRERSETISLRISAVARVHRQRAGALLHGLGLSAGQELLLMLLWEKEPRTQAELTREMANLILLSRFRPATISGQPTWGLSQVVFPHARRMRS